MSNPTTRVLISKHSGAFGLRRAWLLAAAIGALATFPAIAGPQLGTIEECLETGTDLVPLPGVPGGTLSARACSTCETLRLSFDANTRYYLGKEAVPYARLRDAASKGTTTFYVFYRPETRVLTRLRLDAVGTSK